MPALSEYLKQIELCQRNCAEATNEKFRAHWLRIAQGWMVLAESTRSNANAKPADKDYEVSLVEKDGRSAMSANVKSADDAEIIGKAKQLIDGKTVEVHDGERLVASFPPTK